MPSLARAPVRHPPPRQEPTLSTDIRHPPAPTSTPVSARHRRRGWLLLAAAGWSAWVWLTRLGILLDGRNTVPFRIVHGVLIVVSLAFAVVLAVIGARMLREAKRTPSLAAGPPEGSHR